MEKDSVLCEVENEPLYMSLVRVNIQGGAVDSQRLTCCLLCQGAFAPPCILSEQRYRIHIRKYISCSRKYIINTLLLIITGFLATNILRLLLQRYSPWCPLASSTNFLHYRWSLTTACHLSYSHYIQMFFDFLFPSFTWSSTFSSSIVAVAICFGIRWLCILSTWPYHHSRRNFVSFIISAPCHMSFISLFVIPQ